MTTDKLYFSPIKECRDDYFIEYHPPIHGYRFATLHLTYTNDFELNLVAKAMETEAMVWLDRFPIPLMTSAFDKTGDLINLDDVRTESHLISFFNTDTGAVENYWHLLEDAALPDTALNIEYLLDLFEGVGRKTSSELRLQANKQAQQIKIGMLVILIWAVIVPAAVLIIEFFSPQWLAVLVLIYGLSKAMIKALKMTGKWKKSAAEIAKEKEELRIRHHHYHCEQNPEGFMRLKLENFRREQEKKIRDEAKCIKACSKE